MTVNRTATGTAIEKAALDYYNANLGETASAAHFVEFGLQIRNAALDEVQATADVMTARLEIVLMGGDPPALVRTTGIGWSILGRTAGAIERLIDHKSDLAAHVAEIAECKAILSGLASEKVEVVWETGRASLADPSKRLLEEEAKRRIADRIVVMARMLESDGFDAEMVEAVATVMRRPKKAKRPHPSERGEAVE